MDIRQFAVEPMARLHLCDATGAPMHTPEGHAIAVNLYGPGSKQYAQAQAAQSNRMIDLLKKKGKTEKTAEQRREESAEFLADCTHSFEYVERDDLTGHALAKATYADPLLGFLADQVAGFLGDWANFTKGSAKV